ncbi:MAG: hypothetical protein ACK57N_16065 [Planctomycetia bacterium]
MSTRSTLSIGLSLGAMALAVATAGVQSHNRAEADRLARQYTTIKLIEAVNDERAAQIVAMDHEPAQAGADGKQEKSAPAAPVRKGRPAEVRVEQRQASERVQRAKGVL